MRCCFRTHLFSRTRFPERCSGLVCVAPLGQFERRRFNRVSSPQKRRPHMWDTLSFDRQKWVSRIQVCGLPSEVTGRRFIQWSPCRLLAGSLVILCPIRLYIGWKSRRRHGTRRGLNDDFDVPMPLRERPVDPGRVPPHWPRIRYEVRSRRICRGPERADVAKIRLVE